jgi:hypothetical protein
MVGLQGTSVYGTVQHAAGIGQRRDRVRLTVNSEGYLISYYLSMCYTYVCHLSVDVRQNAE